MRYNSDMKRFGKIAVIIILTSMVLNTGCISHYALESNRKHAALRKATLKGDSAAIRAIDMGADGIGVGIDVSNWEAVNEDLFKQVVAAMADAALIWAGKKAIENADNKEVVPPGNPNPITIDVNGSDNTSITINNK